MALPFAHFTNLFIDHIPVRPALRTYSEYVAVLLRRRISIEFARHHKTAKDHDNIPQQITGSISMHAVSSGIVGGTTDLL